MASAIQGAMQPYNSEGSVIKLKSDSGQEANAKPAYDERDLDLEPDLDVRQVAKLLHFSEKTIRRMIRRGALQAHLAEGRWRLSKRSILDYRQRNRFEVGQKKDSPLVKKNLLLTGNDLSLSEEAQ